MSDIDDRAEYLESIGLPLGWNRGLRKCQVCHDRWHRAGYETCYDCRPPWLQFDRKEFSEAQKIDIMERDDFSCSKCGSCADLQIDHIRPCAQGGEADLWNGQVLCAGCNYEKDGDWGDPQWVKRRIELMHFYLTLGWPWLNYEEQELLAAEASNKRPVIGYRKFSGIVTASRLEKWASERKIVIERASPIDRKITDYRIVTIATFTDRGNEIIRLTLPHGQQGPVEGMMNIDAQVEERRPIWYGDQFMQHVHAGGSPPKIPQWAIEEADLCTTDCDCIQ